MKKKLLYPFLSLAIIGVIGGTYFNNTNKRAYASGLPIQDAVTLKREANIDIKEIPLNYLKSTTINNVTNVSDFNFISEQQAIDAANIYSGDLYKRTTIKTQMNLISDDGIGIDAIDKLAVAADPILKNKNKIDEIPVWLVSYEGLHSKKHGVTINEQVVVVDALTGKVLYSFKYR